MNKIKAICDAFELDINNLDQEKYTNPWGNYISKIEEIFKNVKDGIIKIELRDGRLYSKDLNKTFIAGNNQTWHYIYHGLYMFGIIDNRNYSEEKILNNFKVPLLSQYKSFNEYLNNDRAWDRIMSNFKNDKEWFKKRVIGSLLSYSIKNKICNLFSKPSINVFERKKYNSKFNDILEMLYLAYQSSNHTEIAKAWFSIDLRWKKIAKHIVKVIYKENKKIVTKDFREMFANRFEVSNEVMKYIYSFQDGYGSDFDHQIRNARVFLGSKGFLYQADGAFLATKQLEDSDVSYPIKEIKEFLAKAKGELYKNTPLKEIKIRPIKINKSFSNDQIEKLQIIRDARSIFISRMNNEREVISNKMNKLLNTYINSNFKFPERAHIIPVKDLYLQNRIQDIMNHNNGLFLDPNTHTLFDKNILGFNKEYQLINLKTKKVYSCIEKSVLNNERKEYIKEYIEKWQKEI